MTKFELFTMIFYALDAYYDEDMSEDINNFLSDMCPFTFTDVGSADPAVYEEFCDFIKTDRLDVEDSYEVARKYIEWINNPCAKKGFEWVTKEDWINKCEKYLASEHKSN